MDTGILVGILAIIVSFMLFWKHDKDINRVISQIPTRYIGEFPDEVYVIINLIREAKRTIKIVVDVIAYGVFTEPDLYWEYRNWLRKQAANGCAITLIIYDKNQMDININEQFKNADSNLHLSDKTTYFLATLQKNFANLEEGFYRKYAERIISRKLNSNTELFELILDLHQSEIKIFRGWQIRVEEKSYVHEIFYWLSERCAIFSILNESPAETESSFITVDRNFMENLNRNFENKLKKIQSQKAKRFLKHPYSATEQFQERRNTLQDSQLPTQHSQSWLQVISSFFLINKIKRFLLWFFI